MGTMGMQPSIKNEVYAEVAKLASETVNNRASLLIGIMDNSVASVIVFCEKVLPHFIESDIINII